MKLFLLTGLASLISFIPHSLYATSEVDPVLKGQVDLLNELTERRRGNTFFPNEQSIFHGVQKGFVNVGTGNLTFVRRDLVTVGRIPVVLARVYDSRDSGPSDFSSGWRLSLAETIEESQDGTLIYTDDSLTQTRFVASGSGFVMTPAQPSDIRAVERIDENTITVHYRNRWQKRFKRHGEEYRLKKVKDNNGNGLALKYQNGQLASIAGQNGRFVAITRRPSGQITQVMDDQGRTVNYHYNAQGQLSKVIDLGGNAWTYRYTEDGQLRQVKDPRGHEALNVTYDDGQVKRTRIRGAKYRYTYDDETTTVKDEAGNKSTFTQNEDGITVKVKNAEGFVSKIQLDENNQVTQLKHNGQKRGTFTYDDFGNPARMIRYDREGQVELTYLFDWEDRIVEIEGTDGTTHTLSYDEKGNLLSQSENSQATLYTYSPEGDIASQTADGKTITYQHNEDGLLIGLSQGGSASQFAYNRLGRLSSITFPNGNRHTYQYDALGFRTRTERTDGSNVSYRYDSLGSLIESRGTNAKDIPFTEYMTVDNQNRVSEINYADADAFKISYSATSNPDKITWGDREIKYEYDSEGRLNKVIDSKHGVREYEYSPGEADIRKQLDDRTFSSMVDQRKASATLQALNHTAFTRPTGTPWPVLIWDENLALVDLPSQIGLVEPNAFSQSADQRRRLYNATAYESFPQQQFDKASNSFFLPPEYLSVNCGWGCSLGSIIITIPPVIKKGFPTVLTAYPTSAGSQCQVRFDTWFVDGVPMSSGATGSFVHTFNNTGSYQITSQIECPCDIVKFGITTVQVGSGSCSDSQRLNYHLSDFVKNNNFEAGELFNVFNAVIPVKIVGENPNSSSTPKFDKLVADTNAKWNGIRQYGTRTIYVAIQFELKGTTYFGPHLDFGVDTSSFGVEQGYAQRGGTTMRIASTSVSNEVVAHELGHILGFRDAYTAVPGSNPPAGVPIPCHETDIMNADNPTNSVKGYHYEVLRRKY